MVMEGKASILDPRGEGLGHPAACALQGFAHLRAAYACAHSLTHPRPSHQPFRLPARLKISAFSAMVLRP